MACGRVAASREVLHSSLRGETGKANHRAWTRAEVEAISEHLSPRPTREIYLKLIHTDLDDDASVEDFIGRYGMMGLHELKGRYAGRSPADELAGDARPEPDDPLQARRWRARNALTLDRDAYKDGEESFDEFLGAAYLLRDAHTLWRCFNEGLDPYDQLLDLVGAEEFGFGKKILTTSSGAGH